MRSQKGTENPAAKLTPANIIEIRKLRYEGIILEVIAEKFQVNEETIRDIVTLRSWVSVKTKYDTWLLRNGAELNKNLPLGIEVTYGLVRRIFTYDPVEGILRWNIHGRGIPFGKAAGSSSTKGGHLAVSIGGKDYKVQVIIWLWMTGNWPQSMVDHRDRIKQNNKWDNLRLATRSQNAMNTKVRADNTSGHKGVFLVKKTSIYHAYIDVDKKRISLGWGMTFDEAVKVRKAAEKKYHGKFALQVVES